MTTGTVDIDPIEQSVNELIVVGKQRGVICVDVAVHERELHAAVVSS